MPIEIKAYSCQYKCGWGVKVNRKTIENHEKTCFSNPERRACRTCKNWVRTRHQDEDDYCTKYEDERGSYGRPQHDCEGWEAKNRGN